MFVHLHCHSHYSFLRGVASPDEIIAAAVEQKMPAVALTDTNGMYAAVPFYKKAQDKGIKPIIGVALDVEWPFELAQGNRVRSAPSHPLGINERRERTGENLRCAQNDKPEQPSVTMVLLATDMEGYSNLCQLVTLRHLGATQLAQKTAATETDDRPVTSRELAEHHQGVIALAPVGHPALSKKNSDSAGTAGWLTQLKDIFGDRLYLETQHLSPGDGRIVREALRLGHELGIPLVVTNNVHFLRGEEHLHHRTVNAIRTCGLLTTVAPPEITTAEAWFKPAAEMRKCFSDHPQRRRIFTRSAAGDAGALLQPA